MRRLMTPRTAWLALAAALAAAAVLTMRRSRRLAAPRGRPAQHQDEPAPAIRAGAPVPEQPAAVPVLGTPTAGDLKRFAAEPSILDRLPARARAPRKPLSEAARRRLTRWGVAGCALVLLASCTQVLESAVFSKTSATQNAGEAVTQPRLITDEVCGDPTLAESQATCLFPYVHSDDPSAQEPVAPPPVDNVDEDCLPKEATPRVRKIDAKVTRAVNRQWRRIESWLKRHAPRSHRTLGKPGKAADIAAAEADMGLRFPDDLRASLLRHDGSIYLDDTWPSGSWATRTRASRRSSTTGGACARSTVRTRGTGATRTRARNGGTGACWPSAPTAWETISWSIRCSVTSARPTTRAA
ncbi:hypothetical protein [Nonomuraea polychroma]|uniref:hypothetical protein n=1 Tax=Nonomuraea polychroma TaxID=46176 RepID=UPI000FDE4083|nr:hypothetical protein [Nonomuraea polychroma]